MPAGAATPEETARNPATKTATDGNRYPSGHMGTQSVTGQTHAVICGHSGTHPRPTGPAL